MEKIKIIKPTSQRSYKRVINKLITRLDDILTDENAFSEFPTRQAEIIKNLSESLYNVVNSTRIIVIDEDIIGKIVEVKERHDAD